MNIVIFLPGAWHTSRCWAPIVPALAALGHHTLTPDFAGVGDTIPASEISLSRWTDQIAALVETQPQSVILIAHSRGGIVASMVAERLPDKIAKLVYVAGSLIPDGGSIATHGPQQEPGSPNPLQMRADGTATLPSDIAVFLFLNRTPPDRIDKALNELVAEPVWIFGEKLTLTPPRFGRVPRTYIETKYDNAIPLEVQRAMQAALPCDPVFILESDHSPFCSQPEALIEILAVIVAE